MTPCEPNAKGGAKTPESSIFTSTEAHPYCAKMAAPVAGAAAAPAASAPAQPKKTFVILPYLLKGIYYLCRWTSFHGGAADNSPLPAGHALGHLEAGLLQNASKKPWA